MKKKNHVIKIYCLFILISGVLYLVSLLVTKGFFIRIRQSSSNLFTQTPAVKPLCKDCNIVLITLDVCSAKNMPCYGYDRNTTPYTCAFAAKNQLFLNSYSNADWTLPSHTSIMTGLLPTHHNVNMEWQDVLPESMPLLPHVLQNHGYETILFQNKHDGVIPLDKVFYRGVSEVDDSYILKQMMQRLEHNNSLAKKTFISYYMTDCHEPNLVGSKEKLYTTDHFPEIPIEPEKSYASFTPEFYEYLKKRLPKALEDQAFGEYNDEISQMFQRMLESNSLEKAKILFQDVDKRTHYSLHILYWQHLYDTVIDVKNLRMMKYLRALYDQQLNELDKKLQEFYSWYESSPLKKNTIVLITAQHGQEFGEHGVFGHSTLYEGNVRVPFILSVPGLNTKSYTYPVQGVDVMPTLLDIVGVPYSYTFDGLSVDPLLRGHSMPSRIIIAEQIGGKIRTVRNTDWKLFFDVNANEFLPYELYNVTNDPNETDNLLFSNLDIAKSMLEEYKKIN